MLMEPEKHDKYRIFTVLAEIRREIRNACVAKLVDGSKVANVNIFSLYGIRRLEGLYGIPHYIMYKLFDVMILEDEMFSLVAHADEFTMISYIIDDALMNNRYSSLIRRFFVWRTGKLEKFELADVIGEIMNILFTEHRFCEFMIDEEIADQRCYELNELSFGSRSSEDDGPEKPVAPEKKEQDESVHEKRRDIGTLNRWIRIKRK